MKISLQNIAKVAQADINIKGIAVIAGPNDTGKSTVGKALFTIFNSFYNVDERIKNDKVNAIKYLVEDYMLDCLVNKENYTKTSSSYEGVLSSVAEEIIHEASLKELHGQDIVKIIEKKSTITSGSACENYINDIVDVLNLSKEDLFIKMINQAFNSEFEGSVNNVFSEDQGSISLTIKSKTVDITLHQDEITKVGGTFSLRTEAIYTDALYTPAVDSSTVWFFDSPFKTFLPHENHFFSKFFAKNDNKNISFQAIQEQKLKDIYAKLNSLCKGDIVTKQDGLYYQPKGTDKKIKLKNLSSGLKAFVILRKLLLNGSLEQNGTLILDEPEIHLHPEWQLVFAELMVLLQKQFNLHLLLTTHSPYFLRAIQVYAAKHEITDKCTYYMSRLEGNNAYIDDVTGNTERIFESLARPFQTLENEEYDI